MHLRLLATSDLHANLLPYNYYTDSRDDGVGLLRVAGLIAAARAEAPNCLVLDNGDTLQGAPLGDVAVADMLPCGAPHPMIDAMNAIGYDAATLGNHDFDYGLEALEASLAGARFPVVLANAVRRDDGTSFLPPSILLTRLLSDRRGQLHEVRIGITGSVPPQVAAWNRTILGNRLEFTDTVSGVAREAAALRGRGADLVIALVHGGLGDGGDTGDLAEGAENTAQAIAGLADVDAVVAGHTHEVHPTTFDCRPATDRTPIVQPGFWGSHLGIIDIAIESEEPQRRGTARRWSIAKSRTEAVPTSGDNAERASALRPVLRANPRLRRKLAGQHRATRRFTGREIGACRVPLNTYFSFVAPCAATQVVSDAQIAAARSTLAQDPILSGLPLLSAVAPFRCGGQNGPHHYTDIPAGALQLRHAADLYVYPNFLAILRTRGRDLRCWLERSASLYRQIDPDDASPQLLVDHAFAGYNFDRIDGLLYDIDVSRPARTNASGDQLFETDGRIRNLRYGDGRPVQPDDQVLVVTNSYRAAGGGHFRICEASETVVTDANPVRDHLVRYIREANAALSPRPSPTFRLCGFGRAEVVVETGPGALGHTERARELGLVHRGSGEGGFERFALMA
ncbi:bifunctional 2',3'-cyclic-nucleotide 2'-phosphodiesterase/3'-nucleotidase [Roseibacterium sp. SDUM158016]|nr:bifunctional 2',3'-cyclic-nucleotide 2'-phosphodiesterase/3'-nucleotidase [Roseibacterium sp. SDUM158016]